MSFRGTVVSLCLIGLVLAVGLPSLAQTTGLGAVTNIQSTPCAPLYTPSNVYPNSFRNFDTSMTSNCFAATLSGCPNGVADMPFVYAYAPPAAGTPAGTIVMFAGDGGESASGTDFSQYVYTYRHAGYQVVEVAWGPIPGQGIAWEYANYSSPATSPSILNAACRPATFLNWVRNGNSGVGTGIWATYHGGMCVHANSGGAGAVGYALAWYNGGAGGTAAWGQGYIDKAVMENGPVFSNIKQGCLINQSGYNGQSTPICSGTSQVGCNNWTITSNYPLEYQFGDQNSVDSWSGNAPPSPACANNSTKTTYDPTWLSMSIVNTPTSGQRPTFSYPNTAISAWLCQTTASGIQWNNAGAQGQLFYANFTGSSQFLTLQVNGVYNCQSSPEDVEDGTVTIDNNPPISGLTAIENDMTAGSSKSLSCFAAGQARP